MFGNVIFIVEVFLVFQRGLYFVVLIVGMVIKKVLSFNIFSGLDNNLEEVKMCILEILFEKVEIIRLDFGFEQVVDEMFIEENGV